MKLTGSATIVILLLLKLSSDSNSNGAVCSEACKTVVKSITTAIKHLDEVVLNTKKQLYEFAKAF